MNYLYRCIIITTAVRNNLIALSDKLDKDHCKGMFTAPLSATGELPATHWVSNGMVPAPYVNAVTNNVRLFTIAKAAWEAEGWCFRSPRRKSPLR